MKTLLFVMFCRLSQKYIIYLWNIFPQISFFFYFSYVLPFDVFFTHTKILNFMFPHFENIMHHSTWKIWTFWRRLGSLLFTRRSLLSLSCVDYLWVERNSVESPRCLYISKRKMLNGAFSKTKNKVELFPKVHYFSAQHQK